MPNSGGGTKDSVDSAYALVDVVGLGAQRLSGSLEVSVSLGVRAGTEIVIGEVGRMVSLHVHE